MWRFPLGEVIPFRPRSLGSWTGGVTPVLPVHGQLYDTGPLTRDELARVEELLTERHIRTVFTNASTADEPMLPCPLTDVSWLDIIDEKDVP